MVCVVEIEGMRRLVPSCATPAQEGMRVRTNTDTVLRDRRMALELQLSHHTGDCDAPCQVACPASLDIALMMRHIQQDRRADAARLVTEALVLPGILGAICPAPCEKVCRRKNHDTPLAIPSLHGSVATTEAHTADTQPDASGKTVAIVGTGPAGLSAAHRLTTLGHRCIMLDDHSEPGGALRYGVSAEDLPRATLEKDLARILGDRVEVRLHQPVLDKAALDALAEDCDAILLATGNDSARPAWGLDMDAKGLIVHRATGQTSRPGVFAAGALVRPIRRMAVRAVASGRQVADELDRCLREAAAEPRSRPINVTMGALLEGEMERFLEAASAEPRQIPETRSGDVSATAMEREAARCLHCDCRAAGGCALRKVATECSANPSRWKGRRPPFEHDLSHPDVVYEPGKCIACGLCIQISRAADEVYGTAFLGRGIAVRVGAPLRKDISAALTVSAEQCVGACPTGALVWKHD
jgi:ferredoxin